jgi:hypothetical protein
MKKRNVFVIGLDAFNRKKLEKIPSARECCFHKLLDFEETQGARIFKVKKVLEEADRQLREFPGSIDAIVGFWDFPVSLMQPILAGRFGTRSPTLESVLKCEHKFWSRLEQKKVISEHIPRFTSFDPFDEDALEGIDLDYPFWIKPFKSYAGYLGFRIGRPGDFHRAVKVIRRKIGRFSKPFDYLLGFADLPAEVAEKKSHFCLAEEIISGHQCTVEGYVYQGRLHVYGIVDSYRFANRSTFFRYYYPSRLPRRIRERMIAATGKVLAQIGFDNSPFNIEYFYQRPKDRIFLLEINPRMVEEHVELFEKVDGLPTQEILVNLALGRRTEFPRRRGAFRCAGKFFLRSFRDAVVTRVPDAGELRRLHEEVPDAVVDFFVREGMRLSDPEHQDSYSYKYGFIFLGARNQQELLAKFRRCRELLPFEFADA